MITQKKSLTKGDVGKSILKTPQQRNSWAYAVSRHRDGEKDSPLPPLDCLQEVHHVQAEIHTSMNQFTCPVEEFNDSLGKALRRTFRVIDSTGIIGEVVIFETLKKPIGVKDCKKYKSQDQVEKRTKIISESGDDADPVDGEKKPSSSSQRENGDSSQTRECNPNEGPSNRRIHIEWLGLHQIIVNGNFNPSLVPRSSISLAVRLISFRDLPPAPVIEVSIIR